MSALDNAQAEAWQRSSVGLSFLLPMLSGALLWALLVWPALLFELRLEASRPTLIVLYLQPLVVLALSLFFRRAVVALCAFPIALVLVLFKLSPIDLASLSRIEGAASLAVSLVLFVLVVGRFGPAVDAPPRVRATRLDAPPVKEYRWLFRYTWPRFLLLGAVLILPLFALYGEAGQLAVSESFGKRAQEVTLLIHLSHVFVTSLAAYLYFLSPFVNLDLEELGLSRRLKWETEEGQERAAKLRLAVLLLIGFLLGALIFYSRKG